MVCIFPGGVCHYVVLQPALLPAVHCESVIACRWRAAYISCLKDKDGDLMLAHLIHQFGSSILVSVNQFGAQQGEGRILREFRRVEGKCNLALEPRLDHV